jgi:hypothetical protein
VVESFDQLIACTDQHNGLTDCYVSLFAFNGEDHSYGDVLINKAVFDFDDAWTELVRAHEWLEARGAAHFVVFSGSDRSGHLYVLTEPTTHQQSLEYFQRDIVIGRAGLRKCRECGGPVERADASAVASWLCPACGRRFSESETRLAVDPNLVGDAATMIRVPNTWHPRAERFAVPLKPQEVTEDIGPVYELAKRQRDLALGDVVSGHKTPCIDQHADRAEQLYHRHGEKRRLAGLGSDQRALEEFEAEVAPAEMMDDIGCECVLSMITDGGGRRTKPALGHGERRVLISYLVERGYNPEEIARFLEFAVAGEKARHSVVEEEQPVRIWRDGLKAPNAVSLKRRGYFVPTCAEHARSGEAWAEAAKPEGGQ